MSLFIGKTASGKSIIHITNREENADTMRNGTILPSTTFHSDIQFLRYKSYNVEKITLYRASTSYTTILTFPETARKLINDGMVFICTAKNPLSGKIEYLDSMGKRLYFDSGRFIPYEHQCIFNSDKWYKDAEHSGALTISNDTLKTRLSQYSFGPNDTGLSYDSGKTYPYYPIYLLYAGDYERWSDIRIHFLNIQMHNIIPYTPTSYSVTISSSEFTINGENFLHTRYISPEKINNIDPMILINGYEFQFINYDLPRISEIELITSPSQTALNANKKTIFTSSFINPTLSYKKTIEIKTDRQVYRRSIYYTGITTIAVSSVLKSLPHTSLIVLKTSSMKNFLPNVRLMKVEENNKVVMNVFRGGFILFAQINSNSDLIFSLAIPPGPEGKLMDKGYSIAHVLIFE